MDDILIENKDPEKDYILVPITKAKAGIEVCVSDLPEDVYKEAIRLGLKAMANRGQADVKVTGLKDRALENAQKQAMDIAEENVEKILNGKIRFSAGAQKTKGLSREVKTEAMRLARILIKDAIKRGGGKISHYPTKEISAAATEYLAGEKGKEIIAQAEANLAKLGEKGEAITLEGTGLKADAKLVAKADAKKKKKVPEGVVAQAKPKAAAQHTAH